MAPAARAALAARAARAASTARAELAFLAATRSDGFQKLGWFSKHENDRSRVKNRRSSVTFFLFPFFSGTKMGIFAASGVTSGARLFDRPFHGTFPNARLADPQGMEQ